MRVLFIYPNLYTQMGFNHGLASLSACLRSAGHETELINLNENLPPVPTHEEIYAQVKRQGPGLIGFSCLTMQYQAAVEIATSLRNQAARDGYDLPPLIVGGVHPTMVPIDVMNSGVWDHVGVGECEDSLCELVRRVEAGESREEVPNFLSWKAGRLPALGAEFSADDWIHNPVGEFPDMTNMPVPDYRLFDTETITDKKGGWFGLLSSRGCPYRCTYCLNHRIVDRYRDELGRSTANIGFFRFRPADLLIQEIREVLRQYPEVNTFIFDDDLFTHDVDHAVAVCKAYKEADIGIPFVVNSHVKRIDPRVAIALGEAGCRILKLGIESGSPRVRSEVLQRFMTNEDILETVAIAESQRLHSSGFVMVGLPGETHDERWETVDLLAESGIGRFRTSLFFPFPGTESYRLSVEGGYISPEQVASLTDFTRSSCLDFGADENLFVDKLATCMPWFVNARMAKYREAPASARYLPWMERVLAMDSAEWESFKGQVREIDADLAKQSTEAGELHYSIRYNDFMGVRSDFYLAEEAGMEWYTAAALPVAKELAELQERAEAQRQALASAASQSC